LEVAEVELLEAADVGLLEAADVGLRGEVADTLALTGEVTWYRWE
jgi:hypothetical protein